MSADSDMVERVANAIEVARCKGREGPFGGYDYGHNPDFYGAPPEGGRYVIRDFRDPASPNWGKWLHQTDNSDEHEAMLERMTREHLARAALDASGIVELVEALRDTGAALSAVRAQTDDEHIYKLCGEQLERNVAALSRARATVENEDG